MANRVRVWMNQVRAGFMAESGDSRSQLSRRLWEQQRKTINTPLSSTKPAAMPSDTFSVTKFPEDFGLKFALIYPKLSTNFDHSRLLLLLGTRIALAYQKEVQAFCVCIASLRFCDLQLWWRFRYRMQMKLLGQMLYFVLTTGSGQQTLGEEYCDIIQVLCFNQCSSTNSFSSIL